MIGLLAIFCALGLLFISDKVKRKLDANSKGKKMETVRLASEDTSSQS